MLLIENQNLFGVLNTGSGFEELNLNVPASSLRFDGTPDDDRIIGTTEDDSIFAGAGNDFINAGRGDDVVLAVMETT